MKTLFVGAYKESSGWGVAGRSTLEAMSVTSLDVVARPCKFDNYTFKQPRWLDEFEKRSYPSYDAVIYYLPPDNLVYNKDLGRNISYFLCETEDIKATHWLERLELMDEVWVPTSFVRGALLKSGFSKPIRIVPIPCDTSVYYKSWKVYEQIKREKQGDFLFYNIADFNKRKNLEALVKAFHMEFDYNEPVNLCLKISKNQICTEAYKVDIHDWCNYLKAGLKKGFCKDEIILPDTYLTDDEIYGIHKGCDVFVSTSRGEGYNIPCVDAIGFGKTPIVTGWSSPAEYVNENNGWLVKYKIQNCYGATDFPGSLYSSKQRWAEIDMDDLRRCLREAFEDRSLREDKSDGCADSIEQFSYDKVGQIIKKALQDGPEEKSPQSFKTNPSYSAV